MSEKTSEQMLNEIVALKEGGEVRTQQAAAVAEIEECLAQNTHLLIEAPTGSGKALSIDTPILTTEGWFNMGGLKAGMKVFDEKGNPTTILEAHQIEEGKPCYKVSFNDGSSIVADADHLWAVSDLVQRASDTQAFIPIKKIIETLKTNLSQKNLPEYVTLEEISNLMEIPLPEISNATDGLEPVKGSYHAKSLVENIYLSLAREHNGEINGYNTSILTTKEISNKVKVDGYFNYTIPMTLPIQFDNYDTSITSEDAFAEGGKLRNNFNEGIILPTFLYSSVEIRKQFLNGILNGGLDFYNVHSLYIPARNGSLATTLQQLVCSLGWQTKTIKIATDMAESFYHLSFFLDKGDDLKARYITSVEECETRPVRCISVDSESHLFLAGRSFIPTHNTLSYLIPAVNSGKKVVISTATKQLSEQIMDIDVPFLRKALRTVAPEKNFTSSLLKGRDNYYCLRKAADNANLKDDDNSLSEVSVDSKKIADEISRLTNWSKKTRSGDRSEAPAVSDKIWKQYSSNNAECPGKSVCQFGQECFAEMARDKAKYSDVVVTNHAIVARDLDSEEGSDLLGEREVFIFDELHEVDGYMTDAWDSKLSSNMIKDAGKIFKLVSGLGDEYVVTVDDAAKALDTLLEALEDGLLDYMPHQIEGILKTLQKVALHVQAKTADTLSNKTLPEATLTQVTQAKKKAEELGESCNALLDSSIENVRWVSTVENGNDSSKFLNSAPLRIGPRLQAGLENKNAIMIGTSATITVAGEFDIPLHNLGFDNVENVTTLKLDSPFDFSQQAMLFIPKEDEFPSPDFKEREKHAAAVKAISRELVTASKGHALILCTTTYAARDVGKYLRENLPHLNILIQGEKPNPQLVADFKEDVSSVLVATMGMWHGLDVQGVACSLVIMDKIPFKPAKDPLSQARQRFADNNGRNGFMDVAVADANVMLAQGFGRLIRSKSDKGVVAILDTRLTSKPYGRKMLDSLPVPHIFRDKQVVIGAIERLVQSF